jgi:hypothetical protein
MLSKKEPSAPFDVADGPGLRRDYFTRKLECQLPLSSKRLGTVLAFPRTEQGRHDRRIGMSIHMAFEHACDDGETITATELLALMEVVMLRESPEPLQHAAAIDRLLAARLRLFRINAEAAGDERQALVGTGG